LLEWESLKEAHRAMNPTQDQRMSMNWFGGVASNSDSAGLKGSKIRSWPKTRVNAELADSRV
jgi:hypothetical protein